MDYKNWVIEWFVNHSTAAEEDILNNMEGNYFDLGYIDSFQFIELVSEIEETGIVLNSKQFEDRKFSTIKGLIDILENVK